MRKKDTFILHIFRTKKEPSNQLKGVLRHVYTGFSKYFENAEELCKTMKEFLNKKDNENEKF